MVPLEREGLYLTRFSFVANPPSSLPASDHLPHEHLLFSKIFFDASHTHELPPVRGVVSHARALSAPDHERVANFITADCVLAQQKA